MLKNFLKIFKTHNFYCIMHIKMCKKRYNITLKNVKNNEYQCVTHMA